MNKELYISDDMTQKIQKFDSIIFDCDGVLVDIRNSYDNAINKTISAIMNGSSFFPIVLFSLILILYINHYHK